MSEQLEEVYLSPESEAERLWSGAQEAFGKAQQSMVDLSQAVDLGVRVVEIMTVQRLQPVRAEFPATITSLLASPPPEVDPERDFLNPPKSLRFVDALDMLSDMDLACISPQLHHGWEDRVSSCRRSRARAMKVIDFSLNAQQLESLKLIGAYRNRIFLLPPPVRIVPNEVIEAYSTLVELIDKLFNSGEASD